MEGHQEHINRSYHLGFSGKSIVPCFLGAKALLNKGFAAVLFMLFAAPVTG